jgi:hypothetical protein
MGIRGEREYGTYSVTRPGCQPGPGSVSGRSLVQEPGNGNQLASIGGGPGKSFLFCLRRRDPRSHSQSERVLVTRSAVERRGSCGVPRTTAGP